MAANDKPRGKLEREIFKLEREVDTLKNEVDYIKGKKSLPSLYLKEYLNLLANEGYKLWNRKYIVHGAILQPVHLEREGIGDLFRCSMYTHLLDNEGRIAKARIPIGFLRDPHYEKIITDCLESRAGKEGQSYTIAACPRILPAAPSIILTGFIDEKREEQILYSRI